MDLRQVKPSEHLLWPQSVAGQDTSYRGGAGYVVDLSAPLEREWCVGQMHKLAPAGDGVTAASAITNGNALRLVKSHASKSSNAPAKQSPEVAKVGGALPSVDLPPKRSHKE